MCGRYMLFGDAQNEELNRIIEEINDRLKDNPDAPALKTGEIFPTDTVPIIVYRNGNRSAHPARWGFPNFNKPGVIINAKGETLQETIFRKSFQDRRCIVPACGYLEWTKGTPKKERFFIHTGKPLLYMAGLYGIFRDKNDKPYTGFVIVTTEPNAAVSAIHNRMPVILPPDKAEQWLTETDPATLQSLLSLMKR